MAQASAHTFEWIVLLAGAATFAGFAVLFIVAFDRTAAKLGVTTGPTGRIDLIAIYVGFELAFAAFLVTCALRDGWLQPGLLASGMAFAGFGGARAVALAIHRAGAATFLWYILAAEITGAAVSFWAASRLG